MAQLEFIRQQSAAAKQLKPEHVPEPNPKAIEERTRRGNGNGQKDECVSCFVQASSEEADVFQTPPSAEIGRP